MGKLIKYILSLFVKAKLIHNLCVRVSVTLAILLLTACGNEPVDPSQAKLVRVGEGSITVRQFKQIQDMSQDYYWQTHAANSGDAESKALRLLSQITEELLLKEKAKSLELTVDEAEVDRAVQHIKADYPDGTFDQMLLENAVSFDFWRERLHVRLLVDKVIEKELERNVVITPEDISLYYQKNYANISDGKNSSGGLEQDKKVNEIIVKRLRKLKAEKAYKAWIKELQQTYPVEVDWEVWKTLREP